MSDNTSILTGKRKRAAVSYTEPDDLLELQSDEEQEELPVQAQSTDSDDDETYGSRSKSTKKTPPKKKSKPAPKAKKEKPFRFLDLPAELRDMIYELTLADANGVSIVGYQSGYRRIARRGPVYPPEAYSHPRRSRYLKAGKPELCPISTKFVPALLAVNKQINAETINYLYGHDFVFENTTALHSFLAPMSLRTQQRLTSIEIMAWGKSGEKQGHNYSGLTLLSGATNLKSLRITCDVSYWSNHPGRIAARIYRDAHWFFEAFGAANGRKDAAVDILELDESNFISWYKSERVEMSVLVERFEVSLRGLLGVKTTRKSRK